MNKKEIIEQLRTAARQRLILSKALCFFLEKMELSNLSVNRLLVQQIIYSRLKKRYWKQIRLSNELEEKAVNSTIWICWLQGIENAPKLVKRCYESVQKNCREWKVVFLDESNFRQYVKMPDYILRKWKSGKMSNQHFCDLLRLQLVCENGGLWLDATVFLTGEIPEYITKNHFFVYSHEYQNDENVSIGNWLIYSRAKEPIMVAWRDISFEYWKTYDFAVHYFFNHMLFQLIIERYPSEWEKIPFVSDIIPHTLHHEIFKDFDEKRMREIEALTSVHKLSNRYTEREKNRKGTFYDKIING